MVLKTLGMALIVKGLSIAVVIQKCVQITCEIIKASKAVVNILCPPRKKHKPQHGNEPCKPVGEIRHSRGSIKNFVYREISRQHQNKIGEQVGKKDDAKASMTEDNAISYYF